MLVLGIESTAHTFGAGIVEDRRVLSNIRDMYVPDGGGIHPREAADHHVRVSDTVITRALEAAKVQGTDLDLVAFSKGPGLGPCLRVGATVARVLSLRYGIPLVAANHCVAHLEIGGMLGVSDPVLLYASGGNTQVIAHLKGRYRVLGETLDIGIGNMLDKLGRELGIPFPAGPVIERIARGENVPGLFNGGPVAEPELLDMPYSVKGMDVSFSGMMTAALSLSRSGYGLPSICHSVQETAFSMLCEVAERAMAHVGADELLLGGGVACNLRLQQMADIMARERGGRSFVPERPLLVDNGAMIAYLAAVMHEHGISHEIGDTIIDQRFRTDQVDVTWKKDRDVAHLRTPGTVEIGMGAVPGEGSVIGRGAEATITSSSFAGFPSAVKRRVSKGYRAKSLDERLTISRVRKEAKMLRAMREAGVRTPVVLDLDERSGTIVMELLRGPRLASCLNSMAPEAQRMALEGMGRLVGTMHSRGLVHGDLTTSNFVLLSMEGGRPELSVIDCSLSERTDEIEKMGVDLRLFFEVFSSTHAGLGDMGLSFWKGYSSIFEGWEEVSKRHNEIASRGRYSAERWT
ncbi:MAG: bifunctional N(6)-L-threonylcarbamoyladenine synthase/serine/threonine protein kinase [Candidatus Thermoplasmatota archaeon]|jgi:N6-L-threonylcarbamoyladenine synthase/protein kinase Bud32|nr:bifunctional N(6)-L-threonylcarbamoyladenine synthase/serine/threonine protein kinase [Candidatus Thermoplasmatota archaeon]